MNKKAQNLNLNDLAQKYTSMEGGKINMPISQVKELLRIFLQDLSEMDFPSIARLLDKVQKRYGKKA